MSLQDLLTVVPAGSDEEELVRSIDFGRLPRHVAVIMDGNGRWAQLRHKRRVEGHRAGIQAVRDTVETSARIGLEVLTLYAFSIENWKRPQSEVSTLMGLLKRYLRSELDTLLENDIRFRVLGRMSELPEDVQDELRRAEERTSGNTGLSFNIALNYGGRAEITDAVRELFVELLHDGRDPATHRRARPRRAPLHRRPAGPRPPHPHQRRAADLELPPVADRLRGDLGHRRALARLPSSRTCSRPSATTRSGSDATAASPPPDRLPPRGLRAPGFLGNLARRVATALVALPALLAALFLGPPWLTVAIVAAALAVGLFEFFALLRARGLRPMQRVGLLLAAAFFVEVAWPGAAPVSLLPLAAVVAPRLRPVAGRGPGVGLRRRRHAARGRLPGRPRGRDGGAAAAAADRARARGGSCSSS